MYETRPTGHTVTAHRADQARLDSDRKAAVSSVFYPEGGRPRVKETEQPSQKVVPTGFFPEGGNHQVQGEKPQAIVPANFFNKKPLASDGHEFIPGVI